ncbi:GNAT family N-acetyltransferase [Sphingomonas sp.]|uniref:GNAT family N-acetyltransferase n=1 Tax=Sphingomonas sp. TaxID=28214 RepID=UPI002C4AB880|nr:GNAT family N-acetyltransferase [Sphingomonas sp.]HWK37084.1 GNAT family N-acetyltransferase [Sphingomonas sp.]
MITYRDAGVADIPAIDALFRASFVGTFGHLYPPEDLTAFLAKYTAQAWADDLTQADLRIRLAEEDGAAIGFAKVSDITLPVTPAGPALELRQLYLLEGAKGRGVADALMHWAIDQAKGRGAEELFLSVYVDNHRGKRFYARYGFEDVGAYTFMVGSHADEDRLMRRAI